MAKLKQSIKALGLAVNGEEPSGYYITELLRSLGEELTGATFKGKSISDILFEIADNYEAPQPTPAPSGKIEITSTSEVDVTDYASAQVVDANLIAENIKKDVTILGVTGTYEGEAPAPNPSQE